MSLVWMMNQEELNFVLFQNRAKMIEDTISQVANVQSASVSGWWNIIVLIVGLVITVGLGFWYFTRTKSHQLLNVIPTIWTSLGILGTFCAIVKTLGRGLGDLSPEGGGLNVVVNNLVNGIIPAFWTSIIGIIGAIVTTIAIKIIYAFEEEDESDEVERLRRILENNNSLLRQILSLQSSQRDSLSRFLDGHLSQIQGLYDKIYETNKEQAQILIDEYLQGIRTMLFESQTSMTDQTRTLLENHIQTIKAFFAQELQSLNALAEEGKQVIKAIPDSIEGAKADAVEAVEQALVDKYNKLLEGNAAFEGQLLGKVNQLEGTLSQNLASSYGDSINELKGQIEKLLHSINAMFSMGASSLNQTSQTLSAEMDKVSSLLIDSSAEYATLIADLKRVLPVMEKQTNQVEESTKAVALTNDKLKEMVNGVEEIVSKNQQLRFELMQWKRVHRQVKINDNTGQKECPNCHTENPIDANFCRKCTYPFWEIQTIGSKISGDKQ